MQIKEKVSGFIKRYKRDEKFRNRVNLYNGAMTSLVFTIVQLYGGIRYQSVWFFAFGVYYLVLTVVKFYLARCVGIRDKKGWVVFRTVGFVMTILNFALLVMISIMIANPAVALHEYSLVIAIITGAWTLISAGMTVRSVAEMRNKNDPVALADRLVNLTTSVVAVLMLQTSLIASISTPQIEKAKGYIEEFGSFAKIPEEISGWFTDLFQRLATSNTITGSVVAVFTSGITVYMIVRGTREGKKVEKVAGVEKKGD